MECDKQPAIYKTNLCSEEVIRSIMWYMKGHIPSTWGKAEALIFEKEIGDHDNISPHKHPGYCCRNAALKYQMLIEAFGVFQSAEEAVSAFNDLVLKIHPDWEKHQDRGLQSPEDSIHIWYSHSGWCPDDAAY